MPFPKKIDKSPYCRCIYRVMNETGLQFTLLTAWRLAIYLLTIPPSWSELGMTLVHLTTTPVLVS